MIFRNTFTKDYKNGAAMENLFDVPETVRLQGSQESFDALLQGQGELLVERIVSYGHTTPEGEWYDKHVKHRVAYTSSPCIWLAVHGDLTQSI